MCDFALSYARVEELAVEDATKPADARLIIKRLATRFLRGRIYQSRHSAVIGAHTGHGLLVVAVLGDME